MDPCFKYNLKMSSDMKYQMSDGFCQTCLINYKNKNNLSAFHDTKLASQTIKFFFTKIFTKLIISKTTKKQKTDKNIDNIIELPFRVFFLNFAYRLMNEYQMTQSCQFPKVNYRLLVLV